MPHHTSVSLQSVFLINNSYMCLALSFSLTTLPFNRTFLSSLLIASMIMLKVHLHRFSIYPIPSPFLCFSTPAFCWYLLSLGRFFALWGLLTVTLQPKLCPQSRVAVGAGWWGAESFCSEQPPVFSTAGGPRLRGLNLPCFSSYVWDRDMTFLNNSAKNKGACQQCSSQSEPDRR